MEDRLRTNDPFTRFAAELRRGQSGCASARLRILVGLLHRHGVACVMVSGLAAVAHGAMRTTFDVDFVPRWKADNLKALARALQAARARLPVPGVAEPVEVRQRCSSAAAR